MSALENSVGMDYQQDKSTSWMVDTSGKYGSAIKDYLLADGIPEDGASKIIQNAAKVLRFCPNPATTENKSLTGIVIGKVQSGKTSIFLTGWRCCATASSSATCPPGPPTPRK